MTDSGQVGNTRGHPFWDPDRPLAERVADLLSRLSPEEKVALLHQRQPEIARLGLGAFTTGTEVVHGVAWLGPATVFPQAVGLASTWNPALLRAVGSAVGDEVRGMHHRAAGHAGHTGYAGHAEHAGLNVWGPVVNLLRDPRWGRNEEGYSEDPHLTGVLARAYAAGLRGDHPFYLKTAPTLKHFLAYNHETGRDRTSSSVPPRVLREYELKAFEPAIASGAATGVMLSYNLVNGRPSHLSPYVNDVVRGWSGEDVLVVSDAFGPSNLVNTQRFFATHAEAHAAALRAGLDSFTDQGEDPALTVDAISTALLQGLLSEEDIDTAVRRILAIRVRLGEFDPPERVPYSSLTDAVVDCPAHRSLARRAAREGLVLLKNEGETLPLERSALSVVAVVGPHAGMLHEDWYSGSLPYQATPLAGLRAALEPAATVLFEEGADLLAFRVAGTDRYVTAPKGDAGGVLHAGAEAAGVEQTFAVQDWGGGVVTLRARSNDRYVTVDDGGGDGDVLVNDTGRVGGWVVRETFALHEQGDGTVVLRSVVTGRYVTVSGTDGRLAATASAPSAATRFATDVLVRGADAAASVAGAADAAVIVVGNHPMINGRETEDRADLALPPQQDRLVRAVRAANPTVVLVVESGYPYAIDWADGHVPAILWSAHGGQEFGHALAEVLLGEHSPAGRLTQTWYAAGTDLPDLLDYDVIGSRRTYLYDPRAPLYPFGHGLSYTVFDYRDLRCPRRVTVPGTVEVSVEVANTGRRFAEEVVQLYVHQRRSRVSQPLRRLVDFERIPLRPGEHTTVHFAVPTTDLAFWDVASGRYVVESGDYDVMAGRSSADIRRCVSVRVDGETLPDRDLSVTTRAADFDRSRGVRLVAEYADRGDAVGTVGASGADRADRAGGADRADRAGGASAASGASGASGTAGDARRDAGGDAGCGGQSWIAFDGVAVRPGDTEFTARVRKTVPDPAAITIRLDDPVHGPLLGTVAVPTTTGSYEWASAAATVGALAGRHDVYLVLTGPVDVAEFRFAGRGGGRRSEAVEYLTDSGQKGRRQ